MMKVVVLSGRPVPRPCTFTRACRSCAGWDGGTEPLGLCLYRGCKTGRDTRSCNDFVFDPSMERE